jgi:hypothetical protein
MLLAVYGVHSREVARLQTHCYRLAAGNNSLVRSLGAPFGAADRAGVFSEMRDSWNYSFKELGAEVFFGDFRLRKATSF